MPVYTPIVGSYGSIFIARHELLSIRSAMTLNQYQSQRVNTSVLTTPQANQFDYWYMALRVDAAKFAQWLSYFTALPANLQRTLNIDNADVGAFGLALEEMEVDIEKIVNDGTGQYDYIYRLELKFVRSI